MSTMDRSDNFTFKITQLREILQNRGFEAVEIKTQTNFSYFTRGRGFIGLASVMACASLIVTMEKIFLVAENIEASRLYTEQLDNEPSVVVCDYPWDEPSKRADLLSDIIGGLKVASEADLDSELFKLRTVMTPYDLNDYRNLCKTTAEIVEKICMAIKPGITEYELAGALSMKLWSANIEPITLLIAFDERALQYRHPVVTGKALEHYALVAVCGRRNGLIASVTRDVMLRPDEETVQKHAKCANVFATFLSELTPGKNLGDIYLEGISSYAEQGYPLEYKAHHQGGLTGFVPREIRANVGVTHIVRSGEVYAFNPSLQGAKCEETVLVTESGIEIMTHTGNYQYVECHINGNAYMIPTVYRAD